jgi:hypothetical protein
MARKENIGRLRAAEEHNLNWRGPAFDGSGAWVRSVESGQQPPRLYFGITLRRGQAGMAKQLLNRAQIPAMGQEMRREGVPEGMRGSGIGQTEDAAQLFHESRGG